MFLFLDAFRKDTRKNRCEKHGKMACALTTSSFLLNTPVAPAEDGGIGGLGIPKSLI